MKKEKMIWYMQRIQGMSPQEIFHRAVEQIKRRISKYYNPKLNLNINNFPHSILPYLLVENTPETLPDIHTFHALGKTWKLDAEKWQKDPVTGKLWDNTRYCFDVDYRHSPTMGDVKYIWEVNRLQHLQPLALYAHEHGDETAREQCITELMDWIEKNPPYHGVVWASGIELALRVVSILVITSALGKEAFSENQIQAINACLAAHAYWLYRFPSKYSSANNHLVAEAGGLYLLGSLAPYLPHAAKYRRYGWRTLAKEITRQIYPDGVGAEQSVSYTRFSLEWFELCGNIAKVFNDAFPPSYWNRIEKCHEWLEWITDTNGNTVRIGDDDEGKVFAL